MLRALLAVTLGWNLIFFLVGFAFDQPFDLHYAVALLAMVLVAAAVFGVLSFTDFDLFDSDWKGLLGRIGGQTRFEIVNSMGAIPSVRVYLPSTVDAPAQELKIKRTRVGDMTMWWDPQLRSWWTRYRAAHPEYAALVTACAEVLQAYRGVPATVHPAGHGGATLTDHSQNVVLMMLRHCGEWKYTGHHNKAGAKVYGLQGSTTGHHAFEAHDPLLPLAALAHDIGKAICYSKDKASHWFEKYPDHDTVGARLVRMLPESEKLDPAELMRLLLAVGYYHKISRIPATPRIDDRARSLVELLYRVDAMTGAEEAKGMLIGTKPEDPGPPIAPALSEPAPVHAEPTLPESGVESPLDLEPMAAFEEPPSPPVVSQADDGGPLPLPPMASEAGDDELAPVEVAGRFIVHAPSKALTDVAFGSRDTPVMDDGLRFDALKAVLAAAFDGNGAPRGRRLAYRYGDWAYVLIGDIAECLKDYPVPSELDFSTQSASVFEASICHVFEQEQALFRLHAGKYYPPSAALFEVKKEPSAATSKRAIIALARALDLEHVEEARMPSFVAGACLPNAGSATDANMLKALAKRQASIAKSPSKKKEPAGPVGDPIAFDASLLFAWQTSNPGSNPMIRTEQGSLFLVEAVEAMNMTAPARSTLVEHEGRSYYAVVKSTSRRR